MSAKNPKHKANSTHLNKNSSSNNSNQLGDKSFKSYAKKVWNYIWNDDSLGSWLVNIVLAFIIIKFIIYPLMALAFGTGLPVVAVVSGSMEHEGSFDTWWGSQAICANLQVCTQEEWYLQKGINKSEFESFTLHNGFNKGDLILLKGVDEGDISIGDILVYDAAGKALPIIHRVVEISNTTGEEIFQTKGDHNPYQISNPSLDEKNVKYSYVRGKAMAKIPYVGYVKLWAVDLFSLFSNPSKDYSSTTA